MHWMPDPTRYGQTPRRPGDLWDPPYSEWYCESRLKSEHPFELPELTEQTDIAELLSLALSNHPLTRQAWALARAQAYALGAAESAYYPQVNGTWAWEWRNADNGSSLSQESNNASGPTNTNGATGTIPGKTEFVFWNLSVDYLLLDFGGRKASVEAARQALFAVNWGQNRTVQQVIINVIIGYYNYVSAKELVIASKSDVENAKLGLDSAQTLFNAGVGKYLDVLQASTNVQNFLLNLIQAEGQVEIYLAQLATALGTPPSSKIATQNLPEKYPIEEITESVEQLMEGAKRYRPDLASAWAEMLEAKSNIRVQYSSSMPTLTSSTFLNKTKYIKHSSVTTHNYNSVIQLNFPIFQGFYYVNQIRQARENYKAAKANYDNLESQSLLDVVTSYTDYITAKEALISTREYLKFSAEAREVALGSYQAGTATFLDLLSANAALAEAKAKDIDARTNFAISLFNIAFSTGTLNIPYVAKSIGSGEKTK